MSESVFETYCFVKPIFQRNINTIHGYYSSDNTEICRPGIKRHKIHDKFVYDMLSPYIISYNY